MSYLPAITALMLVVGAFAIVIHGVFTVIPDRYKAWLMGGWGGGDDE